MGRKKHAYEQYRNGQWVLVTLTLVTAINLLLAAFSFGLFFPFSAYLPRYLLLYGRQAGGTWLPIAICGCIFLWFLYLFCCLACRKSDRIRAIRIGFLLYTADSIIYFVLALPGILSGGFRSSHVIELLFRAWILYELYEADKVFHDPDRKTPQASEPTQAASAKPDSPDGQTDEKDEDEGIQW